MSNGLGLAHSHISKRLDALDFGALLPGFHRFPFALYDGESVCLGNSEIKWDERFTGNTAIKYDGGWLAIWKLDGGDHDWDRMTANIVHEMCHARQCESGAEFADEVAGMFYPRDLANFAGRHAENLLLARLADDFRPEGWAEFAGLRVARRKLMAEAVDFEEKTEAIEGEATYAELGALKILSPNGYAKKLAGELARLRDMSMIFDVRLSCYSSGAVARMLAAANGAAAGRAGALPAPAVTAELEAEFKKYFGAIDGLLASAMAGAERLGGGMELVGYDPYNVRASGNLLYHPSFVGCQKKGEKPRFLMGRFVTAMKGRSLEIESIYRVPAAAL